MVTCLCWLSVERPDALGNWSNLLLHFCHSSGQWKGNGEGGFSWTVIASLPPLLTLYLYLTLQTGHDSIGIKALTRTHNIYNLDVTSQYIIICITITVVTAVQLQSTLFHITSHTFRSTKGVACETSSSLQPWQFSLNFCKQCYKPHFRYMPCIKRT